MVTAKGARRAKQKSRGKSALRRRAEEQLAQRDQKRGGRNTPGDVDRTVHELTVHPIELELQNEELRQARDALHNSYNELYDFAPVGYLTFDDLAVIRKANLTAAGMLGRERSQLIGKRFAQLVDAGSADRFRLFLRP